METCNGYPREKRCVDCLLFKKSQGTACLFCGCDIRYFCADEEMKEDGND